MQKLFRDFYFHFNAFSAIANRYSDFKLSLIMGIYITFFCNKNLIFYILDYKSDHILESAFFKIFFISLLYAVSLIIVAVLYIIKTPKLIFIIIFFLSICSDYFMLNYGVLIDETVFQSVFETSTTEAAQYYHYSFILHLIFFFIPFLLLFFNIKYPKLSLNKRTLVFGKILFISFLILLFNAAFFYKSYASYLRNNRNIRHMLNPVNFIYQGYNTIRDSFFSINKEFIRISDDAKSKNSKKPKLILFLVGETARRSNFSINGYGRPTSKDIEHIENIYNFTNTTSCGTATAISLPCIFSQKNREDFDKEEAYYSENLVDILKKVGYQSYWIDNNTGCKGICNRITDVEIQPLYSEDICNSAGCYDEILLKAFNQTVKKDKQNQIFYLHMLGSHGPTYYLRYPPQFEIYKPVCATSKLSDCTKEQIINTYDNTIAYTNYVISLFIKELKKYTEYETALIYISDHGESLGENGIYLHSLPYFVSPKEQTEVPFFLWLSKNYIKDNSIKVSNLNNKLNCKLTHDNIFHTMLGMTRIESGKYQNQMDIFSPKFNCLK